VTKSRTFTPDDQSAFAELSGDHNPLHLDALSARRLMYGAPVVHGVHCLLWALDAWLEERGEPLQLRSIEVSFPRPLKVGEGARLLLNPEGERRVKLEVAGTDLIAAKMDCEWAPANQPLDSALDARFPPRSAPRVLRLDEIPAKSGALELHFNPQAAARMFPFLTKRVPSLQIAVLLGTTRLVGMECPGWHSVFFELKLTAHSGHEPLLLTYHVTKFDRRFGAIWMTITAPGLSGEIQAFVRPEPQEQVSLLKLKELVNEAEFSGQRALIVGGSRGLGEVTAKLLAAGGAHVAVTYHQGRAEADGIVEEIIANGGTAESFQLDVLCPSPPRNLAPHHAAAPTHLYYFATPFIFAGAKGVFSTGLFQKFCEYYIVGFLNVLNALKDAGVRKAFYPSSVAVDEVPPDMAEYAAAKMAAEVLCLSLAKNHRGSSLAIYKPRLPRMRTDQTVSLFPASNEEPAPVMLKHLRIFRDQ
jgi:NAD(P)-dependent dehydrogenase (short-subunit alcohol dehydrogenase family)